MIRQIIVLYLFVVALILTLSDCTNMIDVLCPTAGQCPNAPDGIGKDH
jgi:hypothetical protein